jgi:hypothetical protein
MIQYDSFGLVSVNHSDGNDSNQIGAHKNFADSNCANKQEILNACASVTVMSA